MDAATGRLRGGVDIAVPYKSISGKGKGTDSVFGWSDQSWSLFCSSASCSFSHNNVGTEISRESSSSRIRVYVEHRAETLSVYSVFDTMTLLHRVQTTFTQPLYAGFWVGYESKAILCQSTEKMQGVY